MTSHLLPAFALAVFLSALAGCAAQPAAEAAREDLIYFDNRDGRQEKFATLINRAPDGRSTFILRSQDGKSIIVCAGQPPFGTNTAAGVHSALEQLQVAFFQNCLARANGFIDAQEYLRIHGKLVDAASRGSGAGR